MCVNNNTLSNLNAKPFRLNGPAAACCPINAAQIGKVCWHFFSIFYCNEKVLAIPFDKHQQKTMAAKTYKNHEQNLSTQRFQALRKKRERNESMKCRIWRGIYWLVQVDSANRSGNTNSTSGYRWERQKILYAEYDGNFQLYFARPSLRLSIHRWISMWIQLDICVGRFASFSH